MSSRRSADDNIEKISSPAAQFDKIAFLYDELMSGVPYREWVTYLEDILVGFGFKPVTILDLCCGTGRVSQLLAERGYQVSGVDISRGMIEFARMRAEEKGISVDYHVQDAAALRLGRKFDLVISFFDSLNYILESSDLQQVFYRVSEHLQPDGFFIFDMNTELALSTGMFNQSNLAARGVPVNYNWRSSYDSGSRICRVHMDFIYHGSGVDEEIEVIHYQRAYDVEEINSMLRTAGLKVITVYSAYSFQKATKRSDRVFFIAQK